MRWVKQRAIAAKVPVDEWLEEYFGVDAFGGPTVDADAASEPPEVVGRLAWRVHGRSNGWASRAGQRCARSVRAADHQWLRSRSRWQASAAAVRTVDTLAVEFALVGGRSPRRTSSRSRGSTRTWPIDEGAIDGERVDREQLRRLAAAGDGP